MKVIDLHCRPAFLHPFFGGTPGSPEHDAARWLNRRVGTRGADDHCERSLTPEGFLGEVREAGLHKAVVVGRHTPGQHLPNDTIHGIVHGSAPATPSARFARASKMPSGSGSGTGRWRSSSAAMPSACSG